MWTTSTGPNRTDAGAAATHKPKWRQPALDTDAGRLWQVVQEFRNIDTKMMPLYTIQIFLAVALNQGISITGLAQLVGIDQASATRTVAMLASKSERHEAEQGKRPIHLNYIELYQDITDRRRTLCRLSQRGVNFYRTLVQLMGDRNLTVVKEES